MPMTDRKILSPLKTAAARVLDKRQGVVVNLDDYQDKAKPDIDYSEIAERFKDIGDEIRANIKKRRCKALDELARESEKLDTEHH